LTVILAMAKIAAMDEGTLVPIGVAASILGVSQSTVRRWTREGRLAATRTLGGQRRYRLLDVLALRGRDAA
jgi:excisionase family DNA binding protein